MNSPLTITVATRQDVPVILQFIRWLAEYENLTHEMLATEALLEEHLFGACPVAEAVIARLDQAPVGFAVYFTTFSTFSGRPGIWLEDLFVLPDHRREGIGRALMRHVAQLAVSRRYGQMEWSVLDWNEPALRLYQKLGAKAMSDWTTQLLTGDALLRLANDP
jgi:GNAT superfamily N-acetyltransferase